MGSNKNNNLYYSILGFIVGDALGCPLEYEAREALRAYIKFCCDRDDRRTA